MPNGSLPMHFKPYFGIGIHSIYVLPGFKGNAQKKPKSCCSSVFYIASGEICLPNLHCFKQTFAFHMYLLCILAFDMLRVMT
jgi:hypothetical protein